MEKKELKFIHITKCAGTFIEKIGFKNGYKWGCYDKEYGWWHEIFTNKSESLKSKYDWFVVVRNPYDRILSEYYCKWGGIGKNNTVHTKEEFNNYLIKKIQNRKKTGDHYTEQYKYIDKNSKITIIKLENLNEELVELFQSYNIKINVNNHKKQNTREQHKNDILFSIKDFSKELISLINSVYDKDFEFFNYKKIKNY